MHFGDIARISREGAVQGAEETHLVQLPDRRRRVVAGIGDAAGKEVDAGRRNGVVGDSGNSPGGCFELGTRPSKCAAQLSRVCTPDHRFFSGPPPRSDVTR